MKTRKLTPKQDKFARLYIELGSAAQAYRAAYSCAGMTDKSIHVEAAKMLRHPAIALVIKGLQDSVAERHEITVDGQCAKLEKVFKIHHDNSFSASAAVAAVMGQSKLAGIIIDKSKIDANVTVQSLPPLSPEAAAALKQRIEAERF